MSFVIYFWMAKHIEAVVLSLSAFITPIIALVAGVLILSENIAEQCLCRIVPRSNRSFHNERCFGAKSCK